MDFTRIAAILVSISSIIVAIKNIYSFAIDHPRKAYKDHQNKQQEELERTVKRIVIEETKGFKCSEEVLRLVLAIQIERIYWQGLRGKTLFLYNQESLNHLYDAYKKLGGNGHIDAIVAQIRKWEVIDR